MAATEIEHVSYPHTVAFEVLRKDKLALINYQRHEKNPITFPRIAKYRGTIKLHGTNATLIFRNNNTKDVTYQSRNRVITKYSDNQGTVEFLSKTGVEALAQKVVKISGIKSFKEIMIAGELGGRGIQKGVAIATMERFFCIFNIRIDGEWVDLARYASVQIPEKRVFNIMNYQTFEVEIDLLVNTRGVYDRLMEYTAEVAKRCPFAASFKDAKGKPLVGSGEGIVWTLIPDDSHHPGLKSELVNFKTKAEAFVTTASLPKVPVDAGTMERATKFVEYAVGKRRLEQGVEYMREMKKEIDKSNTREYTKWVIEDTLREEIGVLIEMGADEKVARRLIGNKGRVFWFDKCLDEELGIAVQVLDVEDKDLRR